MSRFSVSITIFSIFCVTISGVFSVVTYDEFENKFYTRICGHKDDRRLYPDPTDVCKLVAQQSETAPSSSSARITGACKQVDVKLQIGSGFTQLGGCNMVMCSYNGNLMACASASENDNTIEYYKYGKGRGSMKSRCDHVGSFTLQTQGDE